MNGALPQGRGIFDSTPASFFLAGMCDVTGILFRIESGDPAAAEQLLPLVYDELRKLAAAKLARRKAGADAASDGAGA